MDGTYNDIPADSPDHGACNGFRTSPKQIRRLFQVDLEIDGPEVHGGIDQLACGVHGRILLDGKSYGWDLRQTLEDGFVTTDFPDGISKYLVHRIGDSSDEPRLLKPSKYIDLSWWKR